MNDTTLPIKTTKSTTTTKKPRQKVILRKGFALHDWKRLLLSTSDLAQRKGQPLRPITPSEIAIHDKVHDGWISLHGKVYNVGPYLHYHPGGVDIMKGCLGGDASVLFDKYHRWVNIENLIGPLLLGYLVPDKKKKNDDNDEDDSNISNNNKNNKIIPSALTKAADGSLNVSQLSMPPPRPIDLSGRLNNSRNGSSSIGSTNGNPIPSLLDKKQMNEKNNDDDDDDEDDLNPWEK